MSCQTGIEASQELREFLGGCRGGCTRCVKVVMVMVVKFLVMVVIGDDVFDEVLRLQGRMHLLCQGLHTKAFDGDVFGELFGGSKSLLVKVLVMGRFWVISLVKFLVVEKVYW